MGAVEGDIETNSTNGHSRNDTERASPLPSSDMAATLNKLLILSSPNLRKSPPLDDSSSKSESPSIEEQQVNLVVPSHVATPAGVTSNLNSNNN